MHGHTSLRFPPASLRYFLQLRHLTLLHFSTPRRTPRQRAPSVLHLQPCPRHPARNTKLNQIPLSSDLTKLLKPTRSPPSSTSSRLRRHSPLLTGNNVTLSTQMPASHSL